MEYLFDTNIFVESKKNLPMDIWPTFWTKMIGLIKSGNIHSIDKVKDEIDKGGDELTNWIHKNAPRGFFLKLKRSSCWPGGTEGQYEDRVVRQEDISMGINPTLDYLSMPSSVEIKAGAATAN